MARKCNVRIIIFVISLYFFLKFIKNQNIKYVLLNIFFLAIASYIRPSFSVFVIYFTYKFFLHYYNKEKFVRNFLLIIFKYHFVYSSFLLCIYFRCVLSNMSGLSSNYFNKISIITTIIFFHFIPFYYLFYPNLKLKIKSDFKILIYSFYFTLFL